jgi:hypothetical protein
VLGHKWESAEATVAASRIEQIGNGTGGLAQIRVYDVDVRRPDGQIMRATVRAEPGMGADLAAGASVRVGINAKTGEVRFHPAPLSSRTFTVGDFMDLPPSDPNADLSWAQGQTGGPTPVSPPAQSGVPGATWANGQSWTQGQTGPPTQTWTRNQAGVPSSGGEPVPSWTQGQTGVPADSQPAQSWTQGQTGVPGTDSQPVQSWTQGQTGVPGSTGQPVQSWTQGQTGDGAPGGPPPSLAEPPAATFSSPTPDWGADQYGAPGANASPPASFSSPPVPPPSYAPVTPPSTFGSFGAGGGFGAGGSSDAFGRESKADRIANLELQRDRGQLTPEQFEAARQQIRDEI